MSLLPPPPFDSPDTLPPDEVPRASVADVALCVYASVAEISQCGAVARDRDAIVLVAPGAFGVAALSSFAHLGSAGRERIRHPESDKGLVAAADGLLEDVLGVAGGDPADRSVTAAGILRSFLTAAGTIEPLPDARDYTDAFVDAERRLPASTKPRLAELDGIEFGFLAFLAGRAAAAALAGERDPVRLAIGGFRAA